MHHSKTTAATPSEPMLDIAKLTEKTHQFLHHYDDGDLFIESTEQEHFTFEDSMLKQASFNQTDGFGLRSITGDATEFTHHSTCEQHHIEAALKAEEHSVATIEKTPNYQALYHHQNPVLEASYQEKIATLKAIDAYARAQNEHIRQVSINMSALYQRIDVIGKDRAHCSDTRPLIRLGVTIMLEEQGRMEYGSFGGGGRYRYSKILTPSFWQHAVDEAIRQANVKLQAKPAPAGVMPVILGNGWPGILLHEAIGHGLEGDFNRKGSSAFSELMGKRIATKGVTVLDDGTIKDRRGSLSIDDEGTKTEATTLIEDGILTSYMQDRMNARLTGNQRTGNGRRESYAHLPLPRMTNTYMQNGKHSLDEMIAEVKQGIYATHFGGGQVDITSGKFVFSAEEAYLVENGTIKHPVKGATLIGNGPDVLTKINMIGNDFALDPGIGTCGKEGQSVPVGVGQPSLLIGGLTVGGTA